MGRCVCAKVDTWVNGRVGGLVVDGEVEGWMDEWVEGWMRGWRDEEMKDEWRIGMVWGR